MDPVGSCAYLRRLRTLAHSAVSGQATLGTIFHEACGFEHSENAAPLQKYFINDHGVTKAESEYEPSSRLLEPVREPGVHPYVAPCSPSADGGHHIIGVDGQTLVKMQADWGLPQRLFERLRPRAGYFTMSHVVERVVQPDGLEPRFINVGIADFGYNTSTYACFLRHDLQSHVTLCLCLVWESETCRPMLLQDVVRKAPELLRTPVLLPYLLVRQQAFALKFKQVENGSFARYYDFAKELGVWPGSQRSADFAELIKNMYQLSLNVNEYCASTETLVRTTETLERLNNILGPRDDPHRLRSRYELNEGLEVLRNDLKDQISQFRSYNAIIQTQFSALYSVINQHDSAIYSRISQRHNRTNLRIAQVTRDISQATRLDASSMKIIAAVTFIFLPVTSVSTVFSTTFVNSEGVQKCWPLYVVLCVALTAAAVLIWQQWMRKLVQHGKARIVGVE